MVDTASILRHGYVSLLRVTSKLSSYFRHVCGVDSRIAQVSRTRKSFAVPC